MKRFACLIGCAVSLALPVSVEAAPSVVCKPVKKAEIAALFDRWNASLAQDPKAVGRNYAKDAVLLATVSDKPRLTTRAREDYFEHFLALKPRGKIDTRVIRIGCNSAVDAGTYTFTFGDGRKVKARYTFTYEAAKDGTWLISSHHSSAMPESAVTATR